MRQDFRYALRMLAKNPGFTLAAVLVLALGLCANTAIFSMLNAILIRPLPGIVEPERLVLLGRTWNRQGFDSFSYPNYRDYRDRNSVFGGVLAYSHAAFSVSVGGETERVPGAFVSSNYFDVLGVRPALGRTFLPEEESEPGRSPVVVISHRLWRRWDADPGAIGTKVMLNGSPFTVAGVAPAGFVGTDVREAALDVWVPIGMQATSMQARNLVGRRGWHWLGMIARLKYGVNRTQAEASVRTVARQLEQAYPAENEGEGISVAPYHALGGAGAKRDTSRMLGVLAAVTGLVLLVACANVANLLLSRASVRRREVAIRFALGAGRGRLIRQLLAEGLALSLVAGLASVFLVAWTGDLPARFFPTSEGLPPALDLGLDVQVAGYAVGLALLSTLAFALAPALQASKPELLPALKTGETATTPRRSRLRDGLAVTQVALSVLLLAGAGLLVRTLHSLRSIDPRMRTENVLLVSLDPALNGYTEAAAKSFYEQLLQRLETLPGVESATVARTVPFSNSGVSFGPVFGGVASREDGLRSDCNLVGPDYLRTSGIGLLRGRDFRAGDRPGAPRVVIVNETLAQRLWPGEDPLGRTLRVGDPQSEPWVVVGVAQDSRYRNATERTRPFLYLPALQFSSPVFSGSLPDFTLHVRTVGSPPAMLDLVRRAVRELDSHLPLYNVRTMKAQLDNSFWPWRMAATLVGLFSVVAMAMATVGLYAVVAFHVSQRTREIGLRMALGATVAEILRSTLRQGMQLAAVGLTIGVLLAVAATRVLRSFLYGVTPADPVTFATVSLILLATALIACYVPARRATRVDPMAALRYE